MSFMNSKIPSVLGQEPPADIVASPEALRKPLNPPVADGGSDQPGIF